MIDIIDDLEDIVKYYILEDEDEDLTDEELEHYEKIKESILDDDYK